MTYRIILFAYSEWCQDKEQHSTFFPIRCREKWEYAKGKSEGGERKIGKGKEEDDDKRSALRLHRCTLSVSLYLSRFSRTRFYRILSTCSLFLLPVYSHVLTPMQCFYFFFVPEGTRSIFLGRLRRRSGWRGCSSTMQSMHSETKRQ